jgi:hypothetical protein
MEDKMDIYTAQYKYAGADRMDITAKGNFLPGVVLAPTWEMVRGFKDGTLSQWDYTSKYFSLLLERSLFKDGKFESYLNEIVNHKQTTLVCFCPSGAFCHRILAARMLEDMGYGKYIGEWQI